MSEDESAPRRPGKLVSRIVYASFLAVAGAFIVSSTVQIAVAVFQDGGERGAMTGPAVPPACAAGVRELATAVDRASAAASAARDAAEATRQYRAARSPEWDDPRRNELLSACQGDPRGVEAAAAVARLDRAAEGAAGREGEALGSVRRAVDSFIR
ncbi:MAG: hypothetical protein JST00_24825 [Deltaproteobacteria bacterium]|nr:hypothetical protein [Deltaproteobacteria bacterium]